MADTPEHEIAPMDEEAKQVEDFLTEARDATERVYQMLRDARESSGAVAQAVAPMAEPLLAVGDGAEACRLAGHLAAALGAARDADPDAFARGVRLGFAAGCLVQWRVLEYLVGQEMPLWPVQRYSSDRQVD